MFDHLTNEGMIEAMYLDRAIHKLSLSSYPNKKYMTYQRIWERWLV